jgi:hypothetical protein
VSEQQPGPPSYGAPQSGGIPASYGTPPPPPDYLTAGPAGDDSGDGGGSGNRRWWYVGGGVVAAVALVGGGIAVAATHLDHSRDPGAAAGLPGDTLAYAAVDLDPTAGQKIEAIQALRKFPAFTRGVKLDPTADLRQKLVVQALGASGCDLSWDKDVKPWVGTDVGAAVVPTSKDGPQPVVVIGTTDQAKAKSALPKILHCGGADQSVGLDVTHDWVVIAKTDAIAQSVAAGAAGGSLADDSDFKSWTSRTGDPGVATFYAAPAAGPALASNFDKIRPMLERGIMEGDSFSTDSGSASGFGGTIATEPGLDTSAAYTSTLTLTGDDPLVSICGGAQPGSSGSSGSSDPLGPLMDQEKASLAKFGGAAGTLRFAHGGFEMEYVGKAAKKAATGPDIATLPADTSLAFGYGSGALTTMFQGYLAGFAAGCGAEPAQITGALSELTGLDLPGDLTTLSGNGVTVSLSGSLDPEALDNSTDASQLPVAIRLDGDPAKIKPILDKLLAKLPPAAADQVKYDASGSTVVIGPDADYRAQLLKKGDLGGTKDFRDVVPHADHAQAVFYLDFSQLQPLFKDMTDGDQQVLDNLAHLRALGSSTWIDGDTAYGLFRISTK